MAELPYMVRTFEESDYDLLSQWWDVHKAASAKPPANMLPKIGVLATRQETGEPDACAFLILADGGPMSIIEYPAARPGIGLARTRAAFSAIVTVLKNVASDMGRTYMIAYTLPAIARELRHHGFQQSRSGLVSAITLTAR